MRKERELHGLIYELRQNYPTGNTITTSNHCPNDGCENSARGRFECPDCIEKKIAELTGMPEEAEVLHLNTESNAKIISQMIDKVGKENE